MSAAPTRTPVASDDLAADPGPQRLSPWFGLIGLLLLATLLAAVFVQARQYTLLNQTVQYQDDYLVLNLQQMETEYLRLREQLRKDADLPGSTALQLRYDIFVSRVSLLGSERARRLIDHSSGQAAVLREIDAFTRRADLYLGSEPRGPLSAQAAHVLLAELEVLDEPIHQMMLEASHRVAEQVTERQSQVRDHNRIGLALTGFLVAMVVLFASTTLRQVRKLEARRHRLAQLADQLRDARIEAEAASDAKSEFLADMSHELRTPLHGLLGMLALVRDAPRDARAGDWLRTADESAQHLRRLLDDILDLSKIDSGSLTLTPVAVNLMALLHEVRAVLQPAAAVKGLGLQEQIDPALGALALLDATRVRQVLFNLVANAIKYSESGVVLLHCRRLPPTAGGPAELEFSVSDTGIGMDGDTVARLFRRHSRSDDARAWRQSGTGLGLAISRNLARLMGGEIVVRSTPEAGSVFSFRCPLQPVTEAPASILTTTLTTAHTTSHPAARPPGLSLARPLHVLVAEDHPVNRLYLAALLARLGHRVRLVENGLEALRAMQALDGTGASGGAAASEPAIGRSTPPGLPATSATSAPSSPSTPSAPSATSAPSAVATSSATPASVAPLGAAHAANAAAAAAAAAAAPAAPPSTEPAEFDLVLMDVHMPVMDGVAATLAIRRLAGPAGQVCVVALTADVFADTQQRCMAAGVAEVLTKPLSLDTLQSLLVRRFGDAAGAAPTVPRPLLPPVPGAGRGLLDRATVDSVLDLMGNDQMPALYAGFFNQADDAARRMRESMRDADTDALQRSAHTVKGAALNLGLPALADAAALLSREAGTLAAAQLALAVQRFEEVTAATRALCTGEGLLR